MNSPEQPKGTDQVEAFKPAYAPQPPEVLPVITTPELSQRVSVYERTQEADQRNAENPQTLFQKITGENKPFTEVDIAQEQAQEDDDALSAEKAAAEAAEAAAAEERASVEQAEQEQGRLAELAERNAKIEADVAEELKQEAELRKRLTQSSQIWITPGRHVPNPSYLTEEQIEAQVQQFRSDWLANAESSQKAA